MKKFVLHIVFCLNCMVQGIGQFQPQQSLYMYNPLPINGAAAGRDDALSVAISHRTMWRGITGAPKTQNVSIHTPLKKENLAVGFQITNDKIGVTKRTGIFATGAYRLQLDEVRRIAFAITAGIISNQNNWSDVVTTYEGDQVFESGNVAYWTPNIGASVYYHDKKTFAGISIPYFLNETSAGNGKYKAAHDFSNYNFHLMGGKIFTLKNRYYLKPSMLMKYHKSSPIQTDVTTIAGHREVGEIGFTIRPKQAIALMIQPKVNEQLRIAYSYDFPIGSSNQNFRGSHEFVLLYTFLYKSNAPNSRFF